MALTVGLRKTSSLCILGIPYSSVHLDDFSLQIIPCLVAALIVVAWILYLMVFSKYVVESVVIGLYAVSLNNAVILSW